MILQKLLLFCVFFGVIGARDIFGIDEHWVCNVKDTCVECLLLPHCSWCEAETKCYSKKIKGIEFCSNSTVNHINYGFSLKENSECSCSKGKMGQDCYPPGVTEGPQCSGRGKCVCGQCVCDPLPDPDNPTKMVMGEHCEFDNFSCDGPKCNEGPYSLSQPVVVEDDSVKNENNP